jgi:hypothetical protein
VEFGEDLITLVCLELNARALVSGWKWENLDPLNVGWLGVFIAGEFLRPLFLGALDTVRCTPDSPVNYSGVASGISRR